MTHQHALKQLAAAARVATLLGLGLCGLSSSVQATALLDVGEIGAFTQIYQLNIQNNSNFNGATPGYSVNNAGTPIVGGISRIGYYMELQAGTGARQWVWASMTAFTQNLGQIGVPVTAFWQQSVGSLNVQSNVGGVVTGTGISTGSIEFWNNCYTTGNVAGVPGANGSTYDFGDNPDLSAQCYGSMQIHNYGAGQTLLAYNDWDDGSRNDDLGIGNQASGHPDWTFAYNAAGFTVKSLEVWVQASNQPGAVPEPAGLALVGVALAGIGLARRRHPS